MTDNEIIKALECCSQEDMCQSCPYGAACLDEKYVSVLSKDALDLIKRQKAKIERYQHSITLLEKDVADAQAELNEFKKCYVEQIASMAINRFAESLKMQVAIDLCEAINCSDYLQDDFPKIVDRLVKKMEGDSVGKVSNYDNPSVIS